MQVKEVHLDDLQCRFDQLVSACFARTELLLREMREDAESVGSLLASLTERARQENSVESESEDSRRKEDLQQLTTRGIFLPAESADTFESLLVSHAVTAEKWTSAARVSKFAQQSEEWGRATSRDSECGMGFGLVAKRVEHGLQEHISSQRDVLSLLRQRQREIESLMQDRRRLKITGSAQASRNWSPHTPQDENLSLMHEGPKEEVQEDTGVEMKNRELAVKMRLTTGEVCRLRRSELSEIPAPLSLRVSNANTTRETMRVRCTIANSVSALERENIKPDDSSSTQAADFRSEKMQRPRRPGQRMRSLCSSRKGSDPPREFGGHGSGYHLHGMDGEHDSAERREYPAIERVLHQARKRSVQIAQECREQVSRKGHDSERTFGHNVRVQSEPQILGKSSLQDGKSIGACLGHHVEMQQGASSESQWRESDQKSRVRRYQDVRCVHGVSHERAVCEEAVNCSRVSFRKIDSDSFEPGMCAEGRARDARYHSSKNDTVEKDIGAHSEQEEFSQRSTTGLRCGIDKMGEIHGSNASSEMRVSVSHGSTFTRETRFNGAAKGCQEAEISSCESSRENVGASCYRAKAEAEMAHICTAERRSLAVAKFRSACQVRY